MLQLSRLQTLLRGRTELGFLQEHGVCDVQVKLEINKLLLQRHDDGNNTTTREPELAQENKTETKYHMHYDTAPQLIKMALQRITFIGIGNMGFALAQTLHKAGHDITIWNRTRHRLQVDKLIGLGARVEQDIEVAVSRSEGLVIVCVLDYDTMYKAIDSVASFTGKTVVNLTNGSPRQATIAAQWFEQRQAERYFDGAVMATPDLVGTPHSLLVYSGETEEDFDGVKSLLGPLGTAHYESSDPSSASRLDLAALATMYGMFSGAFIGMALLKRQKGPAGDGDGEETTVTPAVSKIVVPFISAIVPYMELLAKSMDEQSWNDSLGNPLGMQATALQGILQACREEGVDGRALTNLSDKLQRAVQEQGGHGGIAIAGSYFAVDKD